MSELLKKQMKFVYMIGLLIPFAYFRGYRLTFGDAYRYPDCPYGKANSNHKRRLAIDLNLFVKENKKWKYVTTNTKEYEILGKFWEALDKDACWGGRFNDSNHFSLIWKGVK